MMLAQIRRMKVLWAAKPSKELVEVLPAKVEMTRRIQGCRKVVLIRLLAELLQQ